jgi:hypothetical protein
MHFNLYIDDQTGAELNSMAQQSGESRNAIIRHAIEAWITRHSQPQWPDSVLQFKGIADLPAFESYRENLISPKEDPLA